MIWQVLGAIIVGLLAFGAGILVAGALHLLAARVAIASIKKAGRKQRASSALAAWCGCFVRDNEGSR